MALFLQMMLLKDFHSYLTSVPHYLWLVLSFAETFIWENSEIHKLAFSQILKLNFWDLASTAFHQHLNTV